MITRRQLIAAAVAATASACSKSRPPPPRRAAAPVAAPDIAARVGELTRTRTADILALGAGWLASGATPRDVLAVSFHAQVLAGVTSDLHATFVVPALVDALEVLTEHERRLAALWSLQFSAEWLIGEDKPPPPQRTATSIDAAVSAGDAASARDATFTAVVDHGWRRAAQELAPFALRTFGDPHTPIFLGQVVRGLELFGDTHAPALLGRAAAGLARRAPSPSPSWDAARSMSSDELALEVSGMWDGRAPWAAITVAACELIPVAPGASGLGVHTTTMVDAAAGLAAIAAPRDAPLIAFQASKWVRRIQSQHDFMVAPPPDDLPASDGAILAAMRESLRRGPNDPHDYKYVAAVSALSRGLDAASSAQVAALVQSAPVLLRESGVWPDRALAEEALRRPGA